MNISIASDLVNILYDPFRKRLLKNLIIHENSLNNMNGELILSDFNNLDKIIVKKNSLKNLNSLKISNCDQLKTCEFGYSTFSYSSRLTLESS